MNFHGRRPRQQSQRGRHGARKNRPERPCASGPTRKYFDTPKILLSRLKHVLRAKAVLCAGLTVRLTDEASGEKIEWYYEDGLRDYLRSMLGDAERLPADLYVGHIKRDQGARDAGVVEFALAWLVEGELTQESYVNLIPTAQGGTHVNGLRSGLTNALREFCEFRNLLPRGFKLAPEDVWDRLSFVLSLKMSDPQFSGQTKERLSSRDAAGFVENAVHDGFSLYLNQHVGHRREDRAAGDRTRDAAPEGRKSRSCARKSPRAPPWPGKLADCASSDLSRHRACSWSKAIRPRQRQAGTRQGLPGDPALARQNPEHLGGRVRLGARFGGSAQPRGRDRHAIQARTIFPACVTARSSSSPTPTPTDCISRPC